MKSCMRCPMGIVGIKVKVKARADMPLLKSGLSTSGYDLDKC